MERRLYEAGEALAALRLYGIVPSGYRCGMPAPLRDKESYGVVRAEWVPPPPSARAISAMDQALSWVGLIPPEQLRLRRLMHVRLQWHLRRGEPLLSWVKIGELMGVSDKTAKTWWLGGIDLILIGLRRPGLCRASGGVIGMRPQEVLDMINLAVARATQRTLLRERMLELA